MVLSLFVYLILAGSANTVSSRKLKKKDSFVLLAASLIIASRILILFLLRLIYTLQDTSS